MTTISIAASARVRTAGRAWPEIGLLVGALAAVTLARVGAVRAGLDPLAVGAGFGAALTALVLAGGARPRSDRRAVKAVLLGVALGVAVVGAAMAGAALGGATHVPGLGRPAAPFLAWAGITLVVATAEEVLLRGVLFDRLRSAGGLTLAVLATTVVFALVHVPLYGWHVVPLDLAVGLALGGLRIASGGIVAPAVAHALADLATWWL